MLSYHADMDIRTNPFELGLDRLVALDAPHEFIGKSALQKIKQSGVTRKQVGLVIDGEPFTGPNTTFWPVETDGQAVGKVTSAVYSPRLQKNIALAMVGTGSADIGTELSVMTATGARRRWWLKSRSMTPKSRSQQAKTVSTVNPGQSPDCR